MVPASFRRFLSFCAVALLTTCLTISLTAASSLATEDNDDSREENGIEQVAPIIEIEQLQPIVRIDQQPFFDELKQFARFWDDSPIGHVEDISPKRTLLNFYAVMAKVGAEIEAIREDAKTDPGFGWSPGMKERIDDVDTLFGLAIKALNGSDFPESVRNDLVDEAAIELKLVLDYVFSKGRSKSKK